MKTLTMQEEFEERMKDNQMQAEGLLERELPADVPVFRAFINSSVYSFYMSYHSEPGFDELNEKLRDATSQQVSQVLKKYDITPIGALIWSPTQ